MKEQKTNVMRLLEQKKIKYTPHEYPHGDDAVDGATVAAICGLDPLRAARARAYMSLTFQLQASLTSRRPQRRQGRSR